MVQKANYRHIAGTYDASRPLLDQTVETWIALIAQRIGPRRRRVAFLDLGCGIGRFALPIADQLSYAVTGADSSSAMSDEELATTLRLPRKTVSADLAQLAEKGFVKIDHVRSIADHRVTITEYGALILDIVQKQASDASHIH